MIPYDVVRSARKTISIQISPDGKVLVRAPRFAAQKVIEKFVMEKEDWILKHLQKQEEQKKAAGEIVKLSPEEIRMLAEKACRIIPERVAKYAPIVGVTYGRITIRNQKTRWGSCSSKGNLNFNCLLMLTPMEVIDSVVVHELCHRKEMNHSKKFYEEVYKAYPDYKKWDTWLKENGSMIMQKM